MKKKVLGFMMCFCLCAGMMSGCGHEHTWIGATCADPKTCSECGETEGEALGHTWVKATCTEAKTCSVCGEIEGEPLGHTWVKATCTEAKTCSVCGEIEGEPLGHTVTGEATCTEPVLCSVCGKIAIEALGHTWTEATCTEAKTCSVCGEIEGEPLGHVWVEATCQNPMTCSVCGVTEGELLPHDVDDTGYCRMCNEQIGIILTLDNIYQYVNIQWVDFAKQNGTMYYIENNGQKEYVLSLRGYPTLQTTSFEYAKEYSYHDIQLTYAVRLEGKNGHLIPLPSVNIDQGETEYTHLPKIVLSYYDLCQGTIEVGLEGLNMEDHVEWIKPPTLSNRVSNPGHWQFNYEAHVELIDVSGYVTME